jgi:polyferredoxin
MLLVPKTYAVIVLGFDIIMLITVLLFRKPKPKTETLTLDHKTIKRLGYYITGAGVLTLLLGHYAFYANYVDYFEGLMIDAFLFYMGLRTVTQSE